MHPASSQALYTVPTAASVAPMALTAASKTPVWPTYFIRKGVKGLLVNNNN